MTKVSGYAKWRIERRINELERLRNARKEEIARLDKEISRLRDNLYSTTRT